MNAKQRTLAGWLLLLAIAITAACSQATTESTAVPQSDPTTAAQSAATLTVPEDPLATATPAPTATVTTLTLWVPPDLIALSEESRAAFNNQLLTYTASRPDIDLIVEQKVVAGQGGILSYLRTGRNVAPDILPDLIALPTDQALIAANEGLLFPLGSEEIGTAVDDLYPAAQEMATINDEIVVYPFALTNLTHLAYDPAVITDTVGPIWSEVFADNIPSLVFPAADRQGALLALALYLDAGGTLINENNQPALDAEPLVSTLELLSNGRNNGAIQLQSSNIASLEETWQQLELGNAALIQTNAGQFLTRRTQEPPTGFSSVPGIDGPLPPLVGGWAWAVTSIEPDQRPLAEDLLATLIDPAYLGEWTQAGHILPARQSALSTWPQDDPYTAFLQSNLNQAIRNPLSANSDIILAFNNAVFNVISLSASPSAAAEEAIASLQP